MQVARSCPPVGARAARASPSEVSRGKGCPRADDPADDSVDVVVLTRPNRLTSSRMFLPTIRHGKRAGTRSLVVHLDLCPPGRDAADDTLVGFVVSKAVGPAVVRNKVKRRLRHLVRERLASLPGSAVLVVRALPASRSTSYAALAGDLDRALTRALPSGTRS